MSNSTSSTDGPTLSMSSQPSLKDLQAELKVLMSQRVATVMLGNVPRNIDARIAKVRDAIAKAKYGSAT